MLCAASASAGEPLAPPARLFADLPPITAYGKGEGAGYTASPVPSREVAYVKPAMAMPPAPALPRFSPPREYVQGPLARPDFEPKKKTPAAQDKGSVLPAPDEMAQNRREATSQRTDPELLRKYQIFLGLPETEQLFRLESEELLMERMRQENRLRAPSENIRFPDKPVLSAVGYQGRSLPTQAIYAEARYLCYNRLYFQQINGERYGWDLGPVHPFLAAAKFYKDVFFLPAKIATCRPYDCSTGYCLPGDPVPFTIYPPQITKTGVLAQVGAVVGLAAIFP